MTVRRINYSNRKRLKRDQANVMVHAPTGNATHASFDAHLELSELQPHWNAARVFIEAYYQTTRMRFDFGTVGATLPPPNETRVLSDFDRWEDVLFRVKITDVSESEGRIVAWANRIKPKGPDDQVEPDLVRFKDADLHGRLWDIEFDDQGPIVQIERTAGGAFAVGRSDSFIASVYPEIMRRALQQAVLVEAVPHDDDEHWFGLWYEGFLKGKLGIQPPPDDSAAIKSEWIDEAVQAFARKFKLVDFWTRANSSDSEGEG